jgi:hypothetical protein
MLSRGARKQSNHWNRTRSEEAPSKPLPYYHNINVGMVKRERTQSLNLPSSPVIERPRRRSVDATSTSTTHPYLIGYHKSVQFSSTTTRVLIPAKEEQDKEVLFWTCDDLKSFREDAEMDIFLYAVTKCVSMKGAMDELYRGES